ncbi:polysaccharide deacetylase family protein [Streptomyces sp. BE20]|uniref:polysaccharide deacetylase family protein n=1 Tax=Streptomycetaceae TaxID=2062 RepID=UPI002E762975|nr:MULTISPECIES: polysaccharide deacetylase family protein [unclassified Streptomyces]MED7952905.1 polysaccharide deacetylase family protein [Streptomyces sp. BE303]MEE1825140.1 polysaccharide deacetylase family protein [Streptomyces sp. BE20]
MSSPRGAGRPGRTARLLLSTLVAAATAVIALPATSAHAAGRVVYLTFDDGPGPYTPQVLSVLAQYGARATFFEIGQNVARYPELTRRVASQGHSVQNHSWSHPDLRSLSKSAFRDQVTATDARIRAQTGSTPGCLRPPYGGVNATVRSRAAGLGKTVSLWSVDPQDWALPGRAAIERRVLAGVGPGSVVLLHDGGGNRAQTVAALPGILRTLKARGYSFGLLNCR